jgi:hypothetical protein
MAYSVNSDSGNVLTTDSLYSINLLTGADDRMGTLTWGLFTRIDTEGLAFDRNGILWGLDDDSRTLFQINKDTGAINYPDEILFPGFPAGGSNDFGMTFACDNSLYVTSVITHTLYHLDLEGHSESIGGVGALGVNINISAIAAIGNNPTLLYGLGNGNTQSPNLYSIDVSTGIATPIGPLGNEAEPYNEGGLDFDSDGVLWAITDRSAINNGSSQILRIDVKTGAATWVSNTKEVGFESLAIGPPAGCGTNVGANDATPRIPTLNPTGRLLAIFVLMLAGMVFLRRCIA